MAVPCVVTGHDGEGRSVVVSDGPATARRVSATLAKFAEPGSPGMHRTASLDYDIVLEGIIGLELDGQEVLLRPGDIVVQNGTRHRWHIRGSGMARFAAVVIGAHHALVR